MPYCPHCNRAQFESEEVDVRGTKLIFVQCSGCKAPIGIIGAASDQRVGEFEDRVTEALRVLVSTLQAMNSRLDRIEKAI